MATLVGAVIALPVVGPAIFAAPFVYIGTLVFGSSVKGMKKRRAEMLLRSRWELDRLVNEYSADMNTGRLDHSPDKEAVLREIGLPKRYARLVRAGQKARDALVFGESPPSVKSAGVYLAVQKNLLALDKRLLFMLDPALLVATSGSGKKELVLSSDLSTCADGSYRTSIEFAASYRSLVGEEAFKAGLESCGHGRESDREPWYFRRPDYEARLEHRLSGDAF